MNQQPDIIPIEGGCYELRRPWSYEYGDHTLFVPRGNIHDGASVPRILWTLSGLRPDGLLRAAALLHDILYRYAGVLPPRWCQPGKEWTRLEADTLFYDVMREFGVSRWSAGRAYYAVRIGGYFSWKSAAKRSVDLHK